MISRHWIPNGQNGTEAMLIANTFKPHTCQPTFQQISMPVSPKKYSPVCVLTADRSFIQVAGTVSQTSSQTFTHSGEMPVAQPTGLVSQFTPSQSPASTSQKPTISVAVDVPQHSVTSSSEMPVFQPARPASQLSVTQCVTSISIKPLSTSSGAASQYPDSDRPTKEGEVSDRKLIGQNSTLINRYLKSKTTRKPL